MPFTKKVDVASSWGGGAPVGGCALDGRTTPNFSVKVGGRVGSWFARSVIRFAYGTRGESNIYRTAAGFVCMISARASSRRGVSFGIPRSGCLTSSRCIYFLFRLRLFQRHVLREDQEFDAEAFVQEAHDVAEEPQVRGNVFSFRLKIKSASNPVAPYIINTAGMMCSHENMLLRCYHLSYGGPLFYRLHPASSRSPLCPPPPSLSYPPLRLSLFFPPPHLPPPPRFSLSFSPLPSPSSN